jgi:hypothetical protein
LKTEVEACRQAYWRGGTAYNVANIRFNVQSSATFSGFANLGHFTFARTNFSGGGWNNASSRVHIADVNTGLTGSNLIQIRGEYIEPETNPSGVVLGYFLGYTHTISIGGLSGRPNDNWAFATIIMNTDLVSWRAAGSNNTERGVAFRHTALHEMGHVFKLCHPTDVGCYSTAAMHQGLPSTIGGRNWISPTTTNHDRNNLVERWGA